MDEMMLDALFKRGSKARQVAQMLLTGESHTRKELAEKVGVSETTIPRVINALETAGVEVETRTDKSRQVTYHVSSGGALSWGLLRGTAGELPEGVTGYYGLSEGEAATIEILASSKKGEEFRLDLNLNGMECAGKVLLVGGRSIPTAAIMGGEAKILGIMHFEDGRAGYRVADDTGAAVDIVLMDVKGAPSRPGAAKRAGKVKAGAAR